MKRATAKKVSAPSKKRAPTFADLKAGSVTDIDHKQFHAVLKGVAGTLKMLSENITAWQSEAKALLEKVSPESVDLGNIAEVEDYLCKNPPSAGAVTFLVMLVQEKYKSKIASDSALRRVAKRAPAKVFAINEWNKNKGGCKSKADFGNVFAPLIKEKFNVEVTPRTIERDWLPK